MLTAAPGTALPTLYYTEREEADLRHRAEQWFLEWLAGVVKLLSAVLLPM